VSALLFATPAAPSARVPLLLLWY